MKLRPLLRVKVARSSELDEARFVQLWQLRCRLIAVQEEVAPEADFLAFRRFFQGEQARVSEILATDGTLEGFLGWQVRALDEPEAGRLAIIDSDYFFVNPDLRGHSVMSRVALGCYLRAAALHRCARVVIVGHGYPASVMSGARFSGRVRFLQDGDLADWERVALLHFCEVHCGESFDRERGLVRMRTRPRESRRIPRNPVGRELLARFESHDPDWQAGWGLPYLIHLSPASIVAGSLALAGG